VMSSNELADESVTIFIKETSYSINNADEELNSTELANQLKNLHFSLVTLDVDYCAGPVMVAEAYVALANAKPLVQDVQLKASGSPLVSKCNKD